MIRLRYGLDVRNKRINLKPQNVELRIYTAQKARSCVAVEEIPRLTMSRATFAASVFMSAVRVYGREREQR